MRLFIVSETMFFLALFFAWYYMSVQSGEWPPADVPLPDIMPAIANTVLTLISALTMWRADRAIARDDKPGLRSWLAVTALLALAFMAIQTREFSRLAGMATATTYGSLFVVVLFFHVARVFVGIALMVVTFARALTGQFTARRRLMVRATALYWYFIVGVWLAVFVVLYLL